MAFEINYQATNTARLWFSSVQKPFVTNKIANISNTTNHINRLLLLRFQKRSLMEDDTCCVYLFIKMSSAVIHKAIQFCVLRSIYFQIYFSRYINPSNTNTKIRFLIMKIHWLANTQYLRYILALFNSANLLVLSQLNIHNDMNI